MANKVKYKQAWAWPGYVEDFIRSKSMGYTVHVCCGQSQLGDLRIDKYVESADIIADVLSGLPLPSEIADTVISDPPWDMDYQDRSPLIIELRRILKFGGKLIFNSRWCPKCPGLAIEEIWIPTYQLFTFHDLAMIFVARKLRSNMFDVSNSNFGQ